MKNIFCEVTLWVLILLDLIVLCECLLKLSTYFQIIVAVLLCGYHFKVYSFSIVLLEHGGNESNLTALEKGGLW